MLAQLTSVGSFSMRYEHNLSTGVVTEHEDAPVIEATPAQLQAVINNDSLAYLASTDWYVTRESETGVLVPTAVTTARAAARLAIT